MRRLPWVTVLALCAACASTEIGGPALVSLLVVHGPVTAGASASAVFQNQTGFAVMVGDLGCLAEFDVLKRGVWEPVPSNNVCRSFGLGVGRGDTLAFTITAPAVPGIYRIRGQAPIDGLPRPGGIPYGVMLLQSDGFAVR